MARGTKKTIDALEQKFETAKKPVQQDFFDLMASFYHKDEDIAFLINIAKATQTDAQAGTDNTRFMTALRTYQAISYWVRLNKLQMLYNDVNSLIMTRINEMWSQLLATDDSDTVIDTLGEVFLAFNNFNEWTGGLKAEFDLFHSLLEGLSGTRIVKNTLDNHGGRIGGLESLLQDMSGARSVRNTFDSHDGRIGGLESLLQDMSGARSVRNTFDSHDGRIGGLESLLQDMSGAKAVKNTFDDHDGRITTAQSRADAAYNRADAAYGRADDAYSRADDAHTAIGRPAGSGETAWSRMTGIYMYAETVAGVVNQIESMLGGYTFGAANTVRSSVDDAYNRTTTLFGQTDSLDSRMDDAEARLSDIEVRLSNANL